MQLLHDIDKITVKQKVVQRARLLRGVGHIIIRVGVVIQMITDRPIMGIALELTFHTMIVQVRLERTSRPRARCSFPAHRDFTRITIARFKERRAYTLVNGVR